MKARENKSIDYMKKLKSYWDELHPGFAFLGNKNLRDVASRIAVNKVVMDTEFDDTISIATEADIINNEVVDEVNCSVNTVKDQATNETTVQTSHHYPQLKESYQMFYIQYLNVIMKLLKSNLSKKEFILQTVVKHYLMTQSK